MKTNVNRMFVLSSDDYDFLKTSYPTFLYAIRDLFEIEKVIDPLQSSFVDYLFTLKKNTQKSRRLVLQLAHSISTYATHLYDSSYTKYLIFDSISYKLYKVLL